MTSKTNLLDLQGTLHRFGVHRWDDVLAKGLAELDANATDNPSSPIRILFGGSGTLNDLIIGEDNGLTLDGLDEDTANQILRSKIHKVRASTA